MTRFRATLALAVLVAAGQTAHAQTLFVRNPSPYLGYGYGNSNWTEMTGYFNAKFGVGNITQGGTITSLAGYSALYLDANQPGGGFNLTSSEISIVQAFLTGGGRLYGFGENSAWQSWDNQLLGLFGAAGGADAADAGTPLVANSLTAGVTSISTPAPGLISSFNGGVNLFSNGITGLFNNDALVVLDINICDNGNINNANNRRFCQNIVDFTAGAPIDVTSTPEPGSLMLMATGFAGMAGVLIRRRRQQAE